MKKRHEQSKTQFTIKYVVSMTATVLALGMFAITTYASEQSSGGEPTQTPNDVTAEKPTTIKDPSSLDVQTSNKPSSNAAPTQPTKAVATPEGFVTIPLKPTATPETLLAPGEKEYLGRPLSDYEKSNSFQKKDQVVPAQDPGDTQLKSIKQGSIVTFHITMKIETGKIVFDSEKSGRAWRAIIGNGVLISGLDLGIRGMVEGQKRALWIPAHRAYGANGLEPQIPPHSKIYAEVEILTIEDPQP